MQSLPAADPVLNVASFVERTEAEGPGARFALWTQGCRIGCADCCNPHLWSHEPQQTWRVSQLLERIRAARERRPDLEGVTLVGGEPFEQDHALAPLARALRADGLSVLAFSGHLLEDLQAWRSPLLAELDLLVDGPYVQELRTTARRWIGSTNQRMHFLSDFYDPADPRFEAPNTAEIRLNGVGEIQVVGFPFDSVREAFGPRAWKSLKPAARTPS